MLLEKDLKRLLSHLGHDHVVQIPIGNNDLTLRIFDHASKIMISTPVYFGGNFIPSSVRKCALHKQPFTKDVDIKTNLNIDENKFLISLSYLDDIENLKQMSFSQVIEDFGYVADEWRLILDENDKNDLVHIPVR